MNILIVEGEASNSLGGAEISMFSYIKHLSKTNNNIFLAYEKEGDWLNKENTVYFKATSQVNINSFTSQGFISFFKNLNQFIVFAKTKNIDIILTHTIHGFLFLRLANMFLKKSLVVYFKWVYTKPSIGVLNKFGIKAVNKAVFLPSVEDYWAKNGIRRNTKKIALYNGLNISNKPPFNENPMDKIVNLCYFGRITEGKGVHLVVEAISSYSNLNFSIYGKNDVNDSYFQYLNNLIDRKKLRERVTFKGFTHNPMFEMVKYDLVIVPSISYEAQGRVLFEAMFTKTLVIATENGGMPEILGQYRDILTFHTNTDSLKKKLNDIVNLSADEIKNIKDDLFQRFSDNYTEQKTHDKLDDFILDLKSNN